jgi:hydroxymethylpyrimidine kinase/phosphomethylpyrimidine kinase
MTKDPPIVLSVAGSDPSGGAGLQADLKSIHQLGGYGAAVPTLITVQSTRGVEAVEHLSADLVRAQLSNLLQDLEPRAANTGALGSPAVAHVVGSIMGETSFPWVVDPVWLPSRGRPLSRGDIVGTFKDAILARAALLTPNVKEAALLAEMPVRSLDEARRAAEVMAGLGAAAVLVKGGHLEGEARGTDVLLHEGAFSELVSTDLVPGRFHGTGCALSAAIATRLAWGDDVPSAVTAAKSWLTQALRHAFAVGKGAVPVNHLWPMGDKP